MRKSGILLLVMVSLFSLTTIFSAVDVQATSEIIFRPGPGKNDGSDNGSANGGKDTVASGSNPTDNFGSASSMAGSPRSNCNPAQSKAYVQFDLSTLPSTVEQVFLGVTHFPHTSYCYSNCSADFYFYPVTQPWNETTLTNNTMPTEGPVAYGPIRITFPNELKNKEYDITNIYKNWKNGSVPNYGLAIYSPTVGCNNAAVIFNVHTSDDPDQNVRPYLRILSSSPPPPPPPSSSLSDTAWKISGNFTAAVKFPNLLELSLKLPKLEAYWSTVGLGEVFYFHGDGTFEDLLLSLLPLLAENTTLELPPPTWAQSGLNFVIDVTDLSSALGDAIQGLLGDLASVSSEPSKEPSFSGKVDSKGASISGKLAMNYNIAFALGSGTPVNGTISLTMSFKGTPLMLSTTSPRAAFESAVSSLATKATSEGALRVFSAVKNMVLEIKALDSPKDVNLLKSH